MDDPDDEEGRQTYFVGVFKNSVRSRCLLPDDAPRCRLLAGVLIFPSDSFHDSPMSTFDLCHKNQIDKISYRLGQGCDLQRRGPGATIVDART